MLSRTGRTAKRQAPAPGGGGSPAGRPLARAASTRRPRLTVSGTAAIFRTRRGSARIMKETGEQGSRDDLLDEGERYFYEGDYDHALARFDQAIESDEDDAEAHYLRGRALFYLS